jgi:hypothetical protein
MAKHSLRLSVWRFAESVPPMPHSSSSRPKGNIDRAASAGNGSLGACLLYIIACVAVLAALGAAVASFSGSRSRSQSQHASCAAAYYLALSGLNYAVAAGSGAMRDIEAAGGATLGLGQGEVVLEVLGEDEDGGIQVAAVGTADPDGPRRSSCRLTGVVGGGPGTISFENDLEGFDPPVES